MGENRIGANSRNIGDYSDNEYNIDSGECGGLAYRGHYLWALNNADDFIIAHDLHAASGEESRQKSSVIKFGQNSDLAVDDRNLNTDPVDMVGVDRGSYSLLLVLDGVTDTIFGYRTDTSAEVVGGDVPGDISSLGSDASSGLAYDEETGRGYVIDQASPAEAFGIQLDDRSAERQISKLDMGPLITTLLPRCNGLWFDLTYDSSIDSADEFNISDSAGVFTIRISQADSDPRIDYRDYFRERDLIEVIDEDSDYDQFQIIDLTTSTGGGERVLTMMCRRLTGGDISFSGGDDVRVVTNRHGKLTFGQYSQTLQISDSNRFYRIGLGRNWTEYDEILVRLINDGSSDGAIFQAIPTHVLAQLSTVSNSSTDAPGGTNFHYLAFRGRWFPGSDQDWGIARGSGLSNTPADQTIAIYMEDSDDNPMPIIVEYVLIR